MMGTEKNTNKQKLIWLIPLFIVFGSFIVSAAPTQDSLHLNLQVTNPSGTLLPGTYNFSFRLAEDAGCSLVDYYKDVTLTTDSRAIISYYLENITNVDFSNQYYLCVYRNNVLTTSAKIARTPASFTTKDITTTQITPGDLNLSGYQIIGNYTGTIDASQILNAPWLTNVTSVNETDPFFTASPAVNITSQMISDWNIAYGWGNHANVGYLTSYTETDPIFTAQNGSIWQAINNKIDNSGGIINGDLTVNGNLAVVGQYLNVTVVDFLTNGTIAPTLDGVGDLGTPTERFGTVYAINLNGALDASNVTNAPWLTSGDLSNYYTKGEVDGLIGNISLTPGPQGPPGANGTDGAQGPAGANGTNGYTPIKGIDYFDGVNGTNGINGIDGINGTSVTISSVTDNNDGTYTWHFSDGYNFTTSNLTGPQGPQGLPGANGIDGVNGTNGYTPIKGVDYFDGVNGTNGINGIDGINGTSVTISAVIDNLDGTFTWQFSDGYNFTTSNLTGPQGIQGIQGIPGVNGTNGIDGVNGTNGINGIDGVNGTSFDVNGPYLYNNGSNVIFFNDTAINAVAIKITAYNDKGYNLTRGSVVYIDGANNGWPTIELARADAEYTGTVFGVLAETIQPGMTGKVITHGVLKDLDTSAYIPGTLLYLSESVSGQLTDVKPVYPNIATVVAVVIRGDNETGSMFVKTRSSENDPTWNFEKTNYYTSGQVDGLIGNISLTPGPQGPPGANGTNGINGSSVTISNVVDNLDGTFTWQFSDGFNFTTSNLTGPQGVAGTNGIDGVNGTNGIDGINGTSVTITSIDDNLDGTFTWHFSDGYNFTTSNLTGPQGIQGIQGIPGINGTNGIDGANGTTFYVGDGYLYNNGSNVIFFNSSALPSETDPIFTSENSTLWQAINNKIEGNGTINFLPLWTANKTLGDGPIKITTTDETYLTAWDGLLYLDQTNQVAGINVIPGTESHEATFSVNTKWNNGTGTLTTGAYNPTNDYTELFITGATYPESMTYSTRIKSGVNEYFEMEVSNSTLLYIRGNQSFTTSTWEYKPAPYLDVNGEIGDERGLTISEGGNWKWAMYTPDTSNSSQLCFQSNQFQNVMCLEANGDVQINGQLSATTLNTKRYSGTNTYSTIVDNGDGTVTLPTETATLYSDSLGDSPLKTYTITGGATNSTFPDLAEGVNYVWIDYNAGSPIFIVNQDQDYGNYLSKIPYAVITREGTIVVILSVRTTGNALAEKLSERTYRVFGISRESGLVLSEGANRTIMMSGGYAWYGPNRISFEPYDSSNASLVGAGDTILDWYQSINGTWVEQRTRQFNNEYYDDGDNLVPLNDTFFTVNWVYRTVENNAVPDFEYTHLVLGNAQYATLEAARASQPRSDLPVEIQKNSFLIGRIIVEKGANTSAEVGSAFAQTFTSSGATQHNDLAVIQGGDVGQYYHLKLTDYNAVVNKAWNSINTTNNIKALGFNTTAELDNKYYPLNTNPSNYLINETDPSWNSEKSGYYNSSQVDQLISNISLTPGPQGPQGINGTNGIDGVNGTSVTMSNVIDNLDGTFTWQFSDGFNFTTSNLTGPQGIQGIQGIPGINGTNGINGIDGINGTDGVGVASAEIIGGVINITLTNGSSYISTNLTGPQGIQGIPGINGIDGINGTNGIDGINGTSLTMTSITDNGDGTYIWHFSDGTNFTTSNLTGPQGIAGINGTNGINGIDGVNGTDGVGVASAEIIGGIINITLTNGSSYISTNLTGPQGLQGPAGINGTNGIDGANGTSFDVSGPYLYNNGSNVIFFNSSALPVDNDSMYLTNGTSANFSSLTVDGYYFSSSGWGKMVGSSYQFGFLDNTTFTQWLFGNANTQTMYLDVYGSGSLLIQTLPTQGVTIFGDPGIFPFTDGVSPIGNTTSRWGAFYGTTIDASTSITENGTLLSNKYYSTANPAGYINSSALAAYQNATADYLNDSLSWYSIANPAGFLNYSGLPIVDVNAANSKYITVSGTTNKSLLVNETQLNTTIQSIANTKAAPGNCPAGQVVVNTTTAGVQCADPAIVLTYRYADLFNSSSGTQTLTAQNTWYNMTGLGAGEISGWTNSAGVITNTVAGLYDVSFSISGSVNNNDNVEFQMIVNGVAEAKSFTAQRFATGVPNQVSNRFFKRFSVGDNVTMQIRDITRAGSVMTYTNREFVLVRVST